MDGAWLLLALLAPRPAAAGGLPAGYGKARTAVAAARAAAQRFKFVDEGDSYSCLDADGALGRNRVPMDLLLKWRKADCAELTGVSLDGAGLPGLGLDGADANYARLSGAVLTGAALRWTDLNGARLDGAELTGARA
ncbi:MAG: pentapeptide repeat-containing protein, partial [Elusimicrobia bacterium]|nr:pentapeptide repeat-containing protein [Elusimicrobiota bacterium]